MKDPLVNDLKQPYTIAINNNITHKTAVEGKLRGGGNGVTRTFGLIIHGNKSDFLFNF